MTASDFVSLSKSFHLDLFHSALLGLDVLTKSLERRLIASSFIGGS